MRTRYAFTVTQEHIDHPRSLGKSWHLFTSAFGRPQQVDLGKRVYLIMSDSNYSFYQMESNEQRDRRLA